MKARKTKIIFIKQKVTFTVRGSGRSLEGRMLWRSRPVWHATLAEAGACCPPHRLVSASANRRLSERSRFCRVTDSALTVPPVLGLELAEDEEQLLQLLGLDAVLAELLLALGTGVVRAASSVLKRLAKLSSLWALRTLSAIMPALRVRENKRGWEARGPRDFSLPHSHYRRLLSAGGKGPCVVSLTG